MIAKYIGFKPVNAEQEDLKINVITGLAADADVAITGISKLDRIISCIDISGATTTDATSHISITGYGTVAIDDDREDHALIVFWKKG